MIRTLKFCCVNAIDSLSFSPLIILIDILFILDQRVFGFLAYSFIFICVFKHFFKLLEPFFVDPIEGFAFISKIIEVFLGFKHLSFLFKTASINFIHLD